MCRFGSREWMELEFRNWKAVGRVRKFHTCQACGAPILKGQPAFVEVAKSRLQLYPQRFYYHRTPYISVDEARRLVYRSIGAFRAFVCQFVAEVWLCWDDYLWEYGY